MTIWISLQPGCGQYHKKGFKNLFYIQFDNDHKLAKVEDEQPGRGECHRSQSEGTYMYIFVVKVGLVFLFLHLAGHGSLPYYRCKVDKLEDDEKTIR